MFNFEIQKFVDVGHSRLGCQNYGFGISKNCKHLILEEKKNTSMSSINDLKVGRDKT
jgi:hypothetical protein